VMYFLKEKSRNDATDPLGTLVFLPLLSREDILFETRFLGASYKANAVRDKAR
jgi:hypothetical protein